MREVWTVRWKDGIIVPTMDDPIGADPTLVVFSRQEAEALAQDQTDKWGDGEREAIPEFLGYLDDRSQ